MNIQLNLENAIHLLVTEFLQEPYRYFTEADAVARSLQILENDSAINGLERTKDDFQTSLIHREFPTYFRFDDSNPTVRLDASTGASRGHYDVAILNPEFVRSHDAETVKNRNIKSVRDTNIRPLQAVIEFKLDDIGWSNGRTNGAIAELGKLLLSEEEADLRYFIVLMRYTAPTETRWRKYWPTVLQAAQEKTDIKSIFAIHRISPGQKQPDLKPGVRSFGSWLSNSKERYPQFVNLELPNFYLA
jgi:hypothetical protein